MALTPPDLGASASEAKPRTSPGTNFEACLARDAAARNILAVSRTRSDQQQILSVRSSCVLPQNRFRVILCDDASKKRWAIKGASLPKAHLLAFQNSR